MEEKSEGDRNGKEWRIIFIKSKIINEEFDLARSESQKGIKL